MRDWGSMRSKSAYCRCRVPSMLRWKCVRCRNVCDGRLACRFHRGQRRHCVSCEAVPLSNGFHGYVQHSRRGHCALLSDQSCVAELAERYASRREIVAGGLREVGLDVFDSDGGIYAWVHAPEDQTGEQFADMLLERAAVAALPGMCFGKVGKDYVRFSLLKSENQLREAVRRVAAVLA